MEIKRKSPLSRPTPSPIPSFKHSYPIKSSDLTFLNSLTQIKSKVSLVSNKITKNWLPPLNPPNALSPLNPANSLNPANPLNPLNLPNHSKDLNSSVASLELEDTGIERKAQTRTAAKKEKLFKSSSVKLFRNGAHNIEEIAKKPENKKMRTNSLQMSSVETPTFRNLNCEEEEEERKKTRFEEGLDKGGKAKARHSLMQITSHFISLPGELTRKMRNCGLGRGTGPLNKIKVLHHKFPRDMFDHQ